MSASKKQDVFSDLDGNGDELPIDAALREIDGNGFAPDADKPNDVAGDDVDLPAMILELEKIGNAYIKTIDKRLGFPDQQIEVHSSMLAMVINKYFPDTSKFAPEAVLLVLTASMAITQFEILKTIRAEKSNANEA